MSAKHKKRHRPLHPLGGNSLRPAAPPAGRRSRWMPALLLFLGVIALAGWLAERAWLHPGQAASEPPAPPLAQTDMPVNARTARHATQATDNRSEFVVLMNRGSDLLAEGKAAEAAQAMTEATRLNPKDEDAHYNLGLALTRLGRDEEAMQQYGEALRLLPDYAEAHNNLGNLLMRRDRNQEAIQHFEQAITIMPDYASAHNNLGTALQKVGRANDALAHFREAVRLNPGYWQAHFNVGTSCLQKGLLSEAQSEFETVLRLQPDCKPAKSALAAVKARQSSPVRPAGRSSGQPEN